MSSNHIKKIAVWQHFLLCKSSLKRFLYYFLHSSLFLSFLIFFVILFLFIFLSQYFNSILTTKASFRWSCVVFRFFPFRNTFLVIFFQKNRRKAAELTFNSGIAESKCLINRPGDPSQVTREWNFIKIELWGLLLIEFYCDNFISFAIIIIIIMIIVSGFFSGSLYPNVYFISE